MQSQRPLAALAAITTCLGGPAQAHNFAAGSDKYEQFVEGTKVVLIYPSLLLPPVALGIFISLWRPDGLPAVWALYLGGLILGVGLAPFVAPGVALVLMGLGIIVAVLAAILPSHNRLGATILAALTGLLVSAAALEGHGFLEEGVFILLGILFGANLAIAAAASCVRLVLERFEMPWVRIGVRVLASWVAAILVLMLAFAIAST